MDTDILTTRMKSGDEDARSQMLLRVLPLIGKLVHANLAKRKIPREVIDPEDLIQTLVEQLLLEMHKIDKHNLELWVCRFVSFRTKDFVKKKKRYGEVMETLQETGGQDACTSDEAEQALLLREVEEALEGLPPTEAAIVRLTVQGFTTREIATILRLTRSNVSTRYCRAEKNPKKSAGWGFLACYQGDQTDCFLALEPKKNKKVLCSGGTPNRCTYKGKKQSGWHRGKDLPCKTMSKSFSRSISNLKSTS